MYVGGCDLSDGTAVKATGAILYGASTVSSGRDHGTDDAIQTGTEADASGVSVCGPGAEYGSDRRAFGRKFQDHSGKAADRI